MNIIEWKKDTWAEGKAEQWMSLLRKTSTMIGFLLFLVTVTMTYLSKTKVILPNCCLLLTFVSGCFILGLYNAFHPLGDNLRYPFVTLLAPVVTFGGLILGSLHYTYPIGVAFVILWLYMGIGITFVYTIPANGIVLIIYLLGDIYYLHYTMEYRFFYVVFLMAISGIGLISSYIFQRLHRDIVRMADKLDSKLNNKTRLYQSLVHEIRTPLTILRHYFHQNEVKLSESNQADVIKYNLNKLERKMTNLLKLEKESLLEETISDKHIDDEPCCSISQLILYNQKLFESYFNHENITLQLFIQKDLCVRANQSDCEHIILNLLENALEYSHPNSQVYLLATLNKDMVEIVIQDEGVGIEPEILDSLFELYKRPLQAHQHSSSGMGLAIVNQIVKRIGGYIHVESTKDIGSKFTICLPLSDGEDVVPIGTLKLPLNFKSHLPLQSQLSSLDKNHNSSYCIALIEDDYELRNCLFECLNTDYRVISYHNGAHALNELLRGIEADLIIFDIDAESENGYDFFKHYRSQCSPHTPFLFISSNDSDSLRMEALSHGALDYMVKPFTPKELTLKIQSWLDLLKELKGDISESLEDLAEFQALTSRERQLVLMLSKGLSRKEISHRLYISVNTVKTHLSSIYSKCGVSGKDELLSKMYKDSLAEV